MSVLPASSRPRGVTGVRNVSSTGVGQSVFRYVLAERARGKAVEITPATPAPHLALASGVALSRVCRTCSCCTVASPTWLRSRLRMANYRIRSSR